MYYLNTIVTEKEQNTLSGLVEIWNSQKDDKFLNELLQFKLY